MTGVYAVFLLILPLLMVGLGVWGHAKHKKLRLREYLPLNERALFRQPLLWVALSLPTLYFFGAGLFAWWGMRLDLSKEGIETFFKVTSGAFLFLAPVIPLGLLVSRMHASLQSELQMAVQEKQNTFSNFYLHRNEFVKFIEAEAKSRDLATNGLTSIYKDIFPGNFHGELEVSVCDHELGVKYIRQAASGFCKAVETPGKPPTPREVDKAISDVLERFGIKMPGRLTVVKMAVAMEVKKMEGEVSNPVYDEKELEAKTLLYGESLVIAQEIVEDVFQLLCVISSWCGLELEGSYSCPQLALGKRTGA